MSRHRSRYALIAALAGLTVLAGLAWWMLAPGTPPPPNPDLEGREPQVAEKLVRLRQAVIANPDSADVWGRLGSMYQISGFTDEAVECYAVAMQLAPGDFRWPYLTGYALQDDDPATALTYFEAAGQLNDRYPGLFLRKGDLLLRLGRSEAAADAYRQNLAMNPRSSHARLGLARIALLENRPEDAVAGLEEALALRPRHWEVGRLLAQTQTALGNDAEAARLNAMDRPGQIATEPDDPVVAAMWQEAVDSNALLIRGAESLFSGRNEAAVATFEKVVAVRPDSAEHHRWLADAYAASGRVEDAKASYERALAIDRESFPALMGLGAIELATGQADTAVETLGRAVALDADEPTAHFLLGSAQEIIGAYEAAATSFRAATDLDPNFTEAWLGLARVTAASNSDESLMAWRRVVEQAPADKSARDRLATLLIGTGRHEEAIAVLRHGLEINPADVEMSRRLAWELATAPDEDLRNGNEAQRLAEYALSQRAGDPVFSDTLAAAMAENGDFAQAIEFADIALELLDPDGPDALRSAIVGRRELYLAQKPFRQVGEGE